MQKFGRNGKIINLHNYILYREKASLILESLTIYRETYEPFYFEERVFIQSDKWVFIKMKSIIFFLLSGKKESDK